MCVCVKRETRKNEAMTYMYSRPHEGVVKLSDVEVELTNPNSEYGPFVIISSGQLEEDETDNEFVSFDCAWTEQFVIRSNWA